MSLFKSGNPTLSEKRFQDTASGSNLVGTDSMTVSGTMNKFGLLFVMVLAGAFYSWNQYDYNDNSHLMPLILTGAIGGLVLAIAIVIKKQWAPFLAPIYGLLEGLFIGAISAMYNDAFQEKAPNLIMTAVGLTFGTAIAMYLLFSFRIIKVTETFKAVILTATAGIAIFYLLAMILQWTGWAQLSFLHEGSMFGIIFSLFVVAIAALNLILDFDMIEKGAQMGAPKYMEWYGAFGLMVTIIWLYLEILRLLSKLNSRK